MRRSLSGLLMLVLTLGLVAVGLVTPASAAPEPKIWGVVVDGKGNPVLDVTVKATGDGRASDLSYEGGPDAQPGYFELFVGTNGTFTVSFSKPGYESFKMGGVKVGKGNRVVGLGEVELMRSTEVGGKVTSAPVKVGDKPKVRVSVTYAGKGAPTGKVQVKLGSKVLDSDSLKSKDKGVLTLTLPKQTKAGSFKLSLSYAGDALYAAAHNDKAVTLEVKKAGRSVTRTRNALAFVG